jgi:YVTN family beta-propeller protein
MVAAGADIWVLGLSSNTVSEISTSTCAVQRVVTVRFPDYPTDLAADGRRVWLASSSGQIIEINNRTGSVDGSLRLPHSGLPVLAVGDGHIWAGDSMFYRGITEIDASTRKVIHTFLRNRASAWLTYEHRRLWSSGHVLVEIDTSSRRILRTFPMPTHSAPQASVFDGRHLWVVAGSRRIVEVDTRSHRVLGAVVAGRNIGGLAFDGRDIWVTSSGTDRVAEVDTVGRRVIKTLAVGRMPAYLVFAAGHLWVSNYGSSTVQELHAP